jgi:DNA polymerase-3 subunit alpha
MAAVLNHAGSIEKITFFMEECKRMGLLVLGPDINESQKGFAVNKQGHIRFGMMGLKGCGENAIECILEERSKNGPYKSIFDLVKRVNLRTTNKKSLETLAYSGAFDCFKEYHRAQYFVNKETNTNGLDIIVQFGQRCQAQSQSISNSLFGDMVSMDIPTPQLPKCEQWTLTELLDYEKDVTGMFMSGHPLDHFKFEMKHYGFTPLNDFSEVKDAAHLLPNVGNKTYRLAGLVVDAQHRVTKTGRNFGSICIEDYTGKTELMLWSDDYVKFQNYLEKGLNILVIGCFKSRFNSQQYEFKIQSINMLDVTKQNFTKQLIMDVPAKVIDKNFVNFIEKNVKEYPGKVSLKFNIHDTKDNMKLSLYTLEKGFTMNDEMVHFLAELPDVDVKVECV